MIKALTIVVILMAYSQEAECGDVQLDECDAEKDWTAHYGPCSFL